MARHSLNIDLLSSLTSPCDCGPGVSRELRFPGCDVNGIVQREPLGLAPVVWGSCVVLRGQELVLTAEQRSLGRTSL